MIPAYRIEVVLTEYGKLSLDHLPFSSGQTVEVIVLPMPSHTVANQSLKGMVVRYDNPTEPIAEADWGVINFA